MIKVIERLQRGMCAACWQREDLPQAMQIQLGEILQKLRSQCRFDPFAVIQKLGCVPPFTHKAAQSFEGLSL
jgi:hypothetical protein